MLNAVKLLSLMLIFGADEAPTFSVDPAILHVLGARLVQRFHSPQILYIYAKIHLQTVRHWNCGEEPK